MPAPTLAPAPFQFFKVLRLLKKKEMVSAPAPAPTKSCGFLALRLPSPAHSDGAERVNLSVLSHCLFNAECQAGISTF